MLTHPQIVKMSLTPAQARQVDEVCDAFEKAWQSGLRPRIEEHLGQTPEPARIVLLDELLKLDMAYRRRSGERPRLREYSERFPNYFEDMELDTGDEPALADESTTPPLPQSDAETAAHQPAIPGYEILSRLPAGGMGVVYKARDVALDRVVAVKILRPGIGADLQWLARFRAEARAVAALDHPNIVGLYQYGEYRHRPYFVMEFMEGGSLAQKLRDSPLPVVQAVQLMEPLVQAMDYVHRKKIVHRDLKPANILLTVNGTPKIADFGLAKRLDTDSRLTASQTILGTAGYMAPEQAAGKAREVGPSADTYGLGAILYEMLTGRPPFRAETWLETLDQVRFQEVISPSRLRPDLPLDLEAICLKCLKKKSAERYPSAQGLAEDLQRFLVGEQISASAT